MLKDWKKQLLSFIIVCLTAPLIGGYQLQTIERINRYNQLHETFELYAGIPEKLVFKKHHLEVTFDDSYILINNYSIKELNVITSKGILSKLKESIFEGIANEHYTYVHKENSSYVVLTILEHDLERTNSMLTDDDFYYFNSVAEKNLHCTAEVLFIKEGEIYSYNIKYFTSRLFLDGTKIYMTLSMIEIDKFTTLMSIMYSDIIISPQKIISSISEV